MLIQLLIAALIEKGKGDDDLKYKLAKANLINGNPVKISTIERWFREQDVMLTTATNLEIIRRHFNLDKDAVLTEPKEIESVVEE